MILHRARDRDEALARALGLIRRGDVVLVKGSHELGLSILAEALLKESWWMPPGTVR